MADSSIRIFTSRRLLPPLSEFLASLGLTAPVTVDQSPPGIVQ